MASSPISAKSFFGKAEDHQLSQKST